jgi:hypothetical protein
MADAHCSDTMPMKVGMDLAAKLMEEPLRGDLFGNGNSEERPRSNSKAPRAVWRGNQPTKLSVGSLSGSGGKSVLSMACQSVVSREGLLVLLIKEPTGNLTCCQ